MNLGLISVGPTASTTKLHLLETYIEHTALRYYTLRWVSTLHLVDLDSVVGRNVPTYRWAVGSIPCMVTFFSDHIAQIVVMQLISSPGNKLDCVDGAIRQVILT